jgi:hypothetical protein
VGRSIEATGPAVARQMINRAYREGDEHQFLREVARNAIEAGATKVQFGIHWPGWHRGPEDWGPVPTGVTLHPHRFRMAIYDNGIGMGEEIGSYMSGLGMSSKQKPTPPPDQGTFDLRDRDEDELHDNFGIGARVSLLPWNSMGVVVASWTAEDPDGKLIWARLNRRTRNYELADLEFEDEVNDVAPAVLFDEFIDGRPPWLGPQEDGTVGSGTMLLLLGETGQEHTYLGPEGAWNNYTALVYLSQRFWTFPEGVEIRIEDPGVPTPEKWEGRIREREPFHGTALDGTLKADAAGDQRVYNAIVHPTLEMAATGQYTTLALPDGGRIHVHLMPEAPKRPNQTGRTNFTGRATAKKPGISVLYDAELYHRRDSGQHYCDFGVAHSDVARRLWITVEPRPAESEYDKLGGVFPTQARTSLSYIPPVEDGARPGGRDLPWKVWSEVFRRDMPEFVADAINSHLSREATEDIDSDVANRVFVELLERWHHTEWIEQAGGTIPGVPTGTRKERRRRTGCPSGGGTHSPGGATGSPPAPQPTEEGSRPVVVGDSTSQSGRLGQTRPVATGLPACRIENDFGEADEDGTPVAVRYSPPSKAYPTGMITIDANFPVLREVFANWKERYHAHDQAEIEKAVGRVYRTMMQCKVGHILHFGKRMHISTSVIQAQYLSATALTTALFGLVDEEAAIHQDAGVKKLKRIR